jgi:deoxyribonuclease-4
MATGGSKIGRTCLIHPDGKAGGELARFGSVSEAVRLYAKNYGLTAFQFQFGDLHDRSSFWAPTAEDSEMAKRIAQKYGFYYVVHGKYVYNLCRSNWKWQIDSILRELEAANQIGADLILHQGKNLPELGLSVEAALAAYARQVGEIMTISRARGLTNRLVLENSAHQGSEIGYDLNGPGGLGELHKLLAGMPVAYCWDTCHGFTAGSLDLRRPELIGTWLADWDRQIGLSRLAVVHLNDSKSAWCGCHDSHDCLGRGQIGATGLSALVRALPAEIPLICETPTPVGAIKGELEMVKSWRKF